VNESQALMLFVPQSLGWAKSNARAMANCALPRMAIEEDRIESLSCSNDEELSSSRRSHIGAWWDGAYISRVT
jgi:hypothetical protein